MSRSISQSVGPSIGPFFGPSIWWMHRCLPVRLVPLYLQKDLYPHLIPICAYHAPSFRMIWILLNTLVSDVTFLPYPTRPFFWVTRMLISFIPNFYSISSPCFLCCFHHLSPPSSCLLHTKVDPDFLSLLFSWTLSPSFIFLCSSFTLNSAGFQPILITLS